ncbi:hypothetical protein TU65_24905 [Bacillus wiedmannii]|nr:hypothetical protein TU65_24905 [Bacillus wiedmannii]SCN08307.1 Protein of unknown function [Bacillus wiedmannii]
MQELDSSYRDPYATINAKIVLVDGPAEEIFKIHKPSKPSLSSYINGVIESSIQNNQSVSSTIQQLMREQNEEGMTQTVPFIKKTHTLYPIQQLKTKDALLHIFFSPDYVKISYVVYFIVELWFRI